MNFFLKWKVEISGCPWKIKIYFDLDNGNMLWLLSLNYSIGQKRPFTTSFGQKVEYRPPPNSTNNHIILYLLDMLKEKKEDKHIKRKNIKDSIKMTRACSGQLFLFLSLVHWLANRERWTLARLVSADVMLACNNWKEAREAETKRRELPTTNDWRLSWLVARPTASFIIPSSYSSHSYGFPITALIRVNKVLHKIKPCINHSGLRSGLLFYHRKRLKNVR